MLTVTLDPPDRDMLQDRCVVDAPATGDDADGAPNTPPGPGSAAIPCSIQDPSQTRGTNTETVASPIGVETKDILFAADPRIGAGTTLAAIRNPGDATITLASGGGSAFATTGLAFLKRRSDGVVVLVAYTVRSGDTLYGCTLAKPGNLSNGGAAQTDAAFAIGDTASPFTPIVANSVLWWVANSRGPLIAPVAMVAQGTPEIPGGLRGRYTVSIQIRT